MTVVAIIVLVVIVIAMAALLVIVVKSFGQSAQRSVAPESPLPQRPAPLVTDFHVKGDTARTLFAVPLGDAPAGDHLTDLLCANAVEYVRTKKADGLPLDGIHHIEVSAMRGDDPEVVCTIDLPDPGELPDPRLNILVELEHDPIAHVASVVADTTVSTTPSAAETLEPVAEFIELSAPTEAHLRSIGLDPAEMSLDDLVVGLLRVSGYEVSVGRTGFSLSSDEKASIYGLRRTGQNTVLAVIEHEAGSYPELDEHIFSEFAVSVAQTNPDVAILVTDKYGPYAMYEREKRDNRLVFITRERLQAFVDSFGIT
ncbi:MAG: hypothetical protein M3092_00825 [Actinomycetia bacterium]|nr:hypothetical protein [Actinomycetes bacterium]